MFKQGTISILLGCHSPIHSILVIRAWKELYGHWPKFWEFVCIFLHDIGHIGLNYLDDYDQKKVHWKLGARISKKLFGQKGFDLVAGHDKNSGYPESRLRKPDKYSWCIAPYWFLYFNYLIEPKLIRTGKTKHQSIIAFRKVVKANFENGFIKSTHEL